MTANPWFNPGATHVEANSSTTALSAASCVSNDNVLGATDTEAGVRGSVGRVTEEVDKGIGTVEGGAAGETMGVKETDETTTGAAATADETTEDETAALARVLKGEMADDLLPARVTGPSPILSLENWDPKVT